MQQIHLHDKSFYLYITENQIQSRLATVSQEINQHYEGKELLLVVVLKGAFMVAADLIRHLNMNPEVSFIRVSSYQSDLKSSGKVREMLGLKADVADRHVLIVEDIVDTGFTSTFLMDEIRSKSAASVNMFSLLFKPKNLKKGVAPDFVGFEIPPEFVVGYGLDYAEKGRELRGIYRLKDEEKEFE
ncbi:MAG: hypoxanthine phosphoribosyltransferase [Bacteroidota bacterium]